MMQQMRLEGHSLQIAERLFLARLVTGRDFTACGKTRFVSRFVTVHDFQSCHHRRYINVGFSPEGCV